MGCLIGFVLPSILIKNEDGSNPEAGRLHMETYLGIQNILVTALSAPILVLIIKDKPYRPPSAREVRRSAATKTFKQEFKLIAQNPFYVLLIVCYGLLYGCYTTVGAVISPLMLPYGYETH